VGLEPTTYGLQGGGSAPRDVSVAPHTEPPHVREACTGWQQLTFAAKLAATQRSWTRGDRRLWPWELPVPSQPFAAAYRSRRSAWVCRDSGRLRADQLRPGPEPPDTSRLSSAVADGAVLDVLAPTAGGRSGDRMIPAQAAAAATRPASLPPRRRARATPDPPHCVADRPSRTGSGRRK
jgi:hypothetical protein